MSEWNPIVYKLNKIEPLPNSDFLEITTVMNEYPCIIKKGQYKEGQLVSWIPYDSVCPADRSEFSFLIQPSKKDVKNIIIKAKKIRGTYSEGLILDAPANLNEGDSVVEYFGLTKRVYEEELPDMGSNDNEIAPKSFSLFKYDLEGLAKYGYVFSEGEDVIISEKLEGENCAMVYSENKLWVRSRNYFKRDAEDSHWWNAARDLNIEEKIINYPDLVFWGELYGNVKGWKYNCEIVNNKIKRKFAIFDIWDIKYKKFLNWDDVETICKSIQLDTVPVLYKGPWKTDRSLNELCEGKSTIGDCVREGFTVRSNPESWHEKLGRKILKLKGKGYKLAKG